MAASLSCSKVEISFSIVFSAALTVLSSAKFNNSVFDIQRYESLINTLNKGGLSIEPSEDQIIELGKHYVYCLSSHFVFVFLNTNKRM